MLFHKCFSSELYPESSFFVSCHQHKDYLGPFLILGNYSTHRDLPINSQTAYHGTEKEVALARAWPFVMYFPGLDIYSLAHALLRVYISSPFHLQALWCLAKKKNSITLSFKLKKSLRLSTCGVLRNGILTSNFPFTCQKFIWWTCFLSPCVGSSFISWMLWNYWESWPQMLDSDPLL